MYELRIDSDSPIVPKIPKDKYSVKCICGGRVIVQKMMQAVTCKEGWLAVCNKCRATSNIQDTHVEAEGHVIGAAKEKINEARDHLKHLECRKKVFLDKGGIIPHHKEYYPVR